MSKKEMVTLENLGGGAASEMFTDSLAKVIENIINPNTKPDVARTITLKMKIKPDKKLAAVLPFETAMFVGMEHGVVAATEYRVTALGRHGGISSLSFSTWIGQVAGTVF